MICCVEAPSRSIQGITEFLKTSESSLAQRSAWIHTQGSNVTVMSLLLKNVALVSISRSFWGYDTKLKLANTKAVNNNNPIKCIKNSTKNNTFLKYSMNYIHFQLNSDVK